MLTLQSYLNRPVEVSEVVRVISQAKHGKAVGIDKLPNEVFKNQPSVLLIHAFFSKLFESAVLPTVWNNASSNLYLRIVKTIHKLL